MIGSFALLLTVVGSQDLNLFDPASPVETLFVCDNGRDYFTLALGGRKGANRIELRPTSGIAFPDKSIAILNGLQRTDRKSVRTTTFEFEGASQASADTGSKTTYKVRFEQTMPSIDAKPPTDYIDASVVVTANNFRIAGSCVSRASDFSHTANASNGGNQ